MKSKSIYVCADSLAREISERPIFDIEEIKTLIAVRFNDALIDFIKEHASQNEKEYQDLLQQQANNRIGGKEYVSMGYKLAAAKHKKSVSNRILNEVRQKDMYVLLKQYISKKYGKSVIEEFIKETEGEKLFPLISSIPKNQ